MTMKVHIAVIEHKNGSNVYVAESAELIEGEIFDYVADWWAHEFPDDAMPQDRDEAITDYFERIDGEYLTRHGEIPVTHADKSAEEEEAG